MPATEKELKFDFSDASRTDSQKWKLYVKDLSHLVMNTHGPLGSLADPRTSQAKLKSVIVLYDMG